MTTEQLKVFEDGSTETKAVPVKRKVENATSSFDIHTQIKKDNEGRDKRRAKVLRLNGGNPPIPEKVLIARGEQWRSNISFREHEAKITEVATVFHNLIEAVPHIPNVRCDFTNDQQENVRYGKQISEAFHIFLTELYNEFTEELEAGIEEMILFDIEPFFFPDDDSFKIRHLKTNNFLLPNGSKSNPNEWEMCEVKFEYTVNDLWQKISTPAKEEMAKEMGWNGDAIRAAIMDATKNQYRPEAMGRAPSWFDYEQAILNDDLQYSVVRANPIICVHQFVKEMSGKIRRLVFYESQNLNEYIYDKETDMESFKKFIVMFYHSVKTHYHSRRGVGEKIYNHALMMDIINNDAIDSTRLAGSQIYKGKRRQGDRKLKWNKFMFIEDLELQPNNSDRNIQATMGMSRYIGSKLNNNIALDSGPGERESIQPISSKEAALQSQRKGGVQRVHVNRFYRSLDLLLAEMFARTISPNLTSNDDGWDEKEEFYRILVEDYELPEDKLQQILESCKVKSFRSVGFGSQLAFEVGTQELLQLAGTFEEGKRKEAVHMRIASIFDYATAEHFIPINKVQDDKTENTLISMEITHFRQGENVAVEDDQRHLKHIKAIVQFLTEEVIPSQSPAQQKAAQFSAAMQNFAARMEIMQGNPIYGDDIPTIKPIFADLFNVLLQIQNQAKQEQEAAQREAEEAALALQQAQQNEVDPKTLEVLKKHEARMADIASQHQARSQKAQDQHNERIEKVLSNERVEKFKAQLESNRTQGAQNAAVSTQGPTGK